MTQIVNLTKVLQVVDILVTKGGVTTKQAITLYERARAPLPPNSRVCPNWMVRHPKTVKIINPIPAPNAEEIKQLEGEGDGYSTTESE